MGAAAGAGRAGPSQGQAGSSGSRTAVTVEKGSCRQPSVWRLRAAVRWEPSRDGLSRAREQGREPWLEDAVASPGLQQQGLGPHAATP